MARNSNSQKNDFQFHWLFGFEKKQEEELIGFHQIVKVQNELAHATFVFWEDLQALMDLAETHREFLMDHFRLTPEDVKSLLRQVLDVVIEFRKVYTL